MIITKIKGNCQYEGCDKPAEFIASGKEGGYRRDGEVRHGVGLFCKEHTAIVADEGSPEYIDECPNCHCVFGVN